MITQAQFKQAMKVLHEGSTIVNTDRLSHCELCKVYDRCMTIKMWDPESDTVLDSPLMCSKCIDQRD